MRANPWSAALRACDHADAYRPTGEHKPGNDRTSSVAASSISGSRIALLNSLSSSGDTAHRRTRMFPPKRSTSRTRGEGFQEQTVAWQKPLTLNFSSILRGCQTDSLQSRNFEARWQVHLKERHQSIAIFPAPLPHRPHYLAASISRLPELTARSARPTP